MQTQKQYHPCIELMWDIHAKVSNFTAQLIGPAVFNFNGKEKSWNLSTADLLLFPNGSVGKTLGEFLSQNKLEPLAGAESHDVYHILFDFSISFKDEIGLQFFLRGNGKNSFASFATSIGAWFLLPLSWKYLRESYRKGKNCLDISTLNTKTLLNEDLALVKASLYHSTQTKN
jgi:hypothetical protein